MIKNWLVLGSVAFGVGFSLSLPVTRNIKNSALIGLVTVPAATAGALTISGQQKREFGTLFSSLHIQVQTLEQQRDALQQSIVQFQDRQQECEAQCKHLAAQLEQGQAQLNADEQRRQTLHQELTALEGEKNAVQLLAASLQTEVNTLEQQKQLLDKTVAEIHEQRQQATVELEQLRIQQHEIQTQIKADDQQRQTVQQELATLETRQQSLNEETDRLSEHLQNLRAQENQLNSSLVNRIADQNQLEQQLAATEQQRAIVQGELTLLETRKQTLAGETLAAEYQLKELKAQTQQFNVLLTQQSEQKQNIEADLRQLRSQLQDYQQQRTSLIQEVNSLSDQKGDLTEFLRQLQEQIDAAQAQALKSQVLQSAPDEPDFPPELPAVESVLPEAIAEFVPPSTAVTISIPRSVPIEEEYDAPETATEFRLTNPEHTRWLWEAMIVARWQYPRFLGSVCLPRYDTDEVWGTETILDLVGDNLKRLGANALEYDRLRERLGDEEELNWLKILTFAMSEYAYYMESESGFWKGLCERLKLPYQSDRQEPIPTLKRLASVGIELLQLPAAVGGYPIVSTLWLQSGIPYRNLNHFADVAADLVEELGWNYLLNADAQLLAQKLLNTCESRYPGRTVLRRFLEYGCRSQAESVSGKLLQSIAGVAVALHKYNLSAQDVLLNPSRRQEFLLNAVPQFNFFLRDWDALIQILIPRPSSAAQRRQNGGQVPLALRLDIEDLLIELVLPEQTLRNADWLPETCQIQEAGWQGEVDSSGQVTIEECIQPVDQISEGWHWQLLDEQGNCLRSWYLEGIPIDYPYLVFDAWTGDRHLPNPQISDSPEIFCFVPTGTTINFTGAIELAEVSLIPCSIHGWQGKRLRLTGQSGTLHLQFSDRSLALDWTAATAEPKLCGLRLRGQNAPYLEPPSLWYPSCSIARSLTLTLQERFVESNPLRIQQTISIPALEQWFEISLNQWINHPGHYSVILTAPEEEWSQTFEVQSSYHVTSDEVKALPAIQMTDTQGIPIALPLTVTKSHQFWSTTLLITGLWTLEPIKLWLSDGQSEVSRIVQADGSGHLRLELSTLHDLLPTSTKYSLDYQRSGDPPQRLVRLIEDVPLSWQWNDRALELSGLETDRTYEICGWNLLTPEHSSIKLPVPSAVAATVPLELPPGIYFLQLQTSDQSSENLGWWCGSEQYDLPAATQNDESLANYCYTILDNTLLTDFQVATTCFSWDENWIKTIAASLEMGKYHFPNWLDAEILLAKLRSILAPPHGQWYKICTREGKRADFCSALMETIAENNLWHLILEFRRHRQQDERNIAFVNLVNIERVRPYLTQIPDFEWISRSPLTSEEVENLLEDRNVA